MYRYILMTVGAVRILSVQIGNYSYCLATCIPLAVKLVEYVKTATKEKNWANLLGLVMSLMEQAEKKFDDGATRKEWVMAMVKASADYINYPVDEDDAVQDDRQSLQYVQGCKRQKSGG